MKTHLFTSWTAAVAAGCCLLTSAAFAHVTIEIKQAPVDAGYKGPFVCPMGAQASRPPASACRYRTA